MPFCGPLASHRVAQIMKQRFLFRAFPLVILLAECALPAIPAMAAENMTPLPSGSISDGLRAMIPERGVGSTVAATRWDYGFLTGNGALGAVVFGQPTNETLIFNHARLYLPSPAPKIVQHNFGEARRIAREQGVAAARAFSDKEAKDAGHTYHQGDPYHIGFELKLDMPAAGTVSDYLRTTDFRTGEVAVRFKDDAGECVRRLFVSKPDNAAVMSITRPGHKSVSLTLRPTPLVHGLLKSELSVSKEWISYGNAYTLSPGGYDNAVRIVAKGGVVESDGKSVTIKGADEVLLITGIAWQKERKAGSLDALKSRLAAMPADYDKLLRPHATQWSQVMDRVSLSIGGDKGPRQTSEELLALAKAGGFKNNPRTLIERMYDAGRFYFLCSSGELPPNLQGIWNGAFTAPWGGSFTCDTNLEIALDAAYSADMAENMESFFRMVEEHLPEWRQNAKNLFGYRGVVGPIVCSGNSHVTQAYNGQWGWNFWTPGAGMLASYFYDHWLFTGDRNFLAKRAVPLMKEIALFYEDYLCETDDKGFFVFPLSSSPEVGGLQLSRNSLLDVSVAKELFTNLIASCETLGIEKENVKKWRGMLAKMPPYQISPKGDLCEWADGTFGHAYNHRHHSPFYPIFRSFEFTPEKTPDLWKASINSYDKKVSLWLRAGTDYPGIPFGRSFNAQCAAYLGRGDGVGENLNAMADRTYPSLFMSIGPGGNSFGFDGLGTYPDIINRSLAFALNGTLDLLRSVPPDWETGSISGIRARGQLKIHRLVWNQKEGRVELEVTSGIAQKITLRLPCSKAVHEVRVISGKVTVSPAATANAREVLLPQNQPVRLTINFDPDEVGVPILGDRSEVRWKIAAVSSEGGGGAAINAIDGDPATVWHTYGAGNEQMPQSFTVDMGAIKTVKGFTYIPRKETVNGRVDRYRFEVSEDGKTWKVSGEGEFGNMRANPVKQTVPFAPAKARYFRFTALHSLEYNHAAVAEIGVVE